MTLKRNDEVERIREVAWPIATRFINGISLVCNNKFEDGAKMTVAVACTIMERTVCALAWQLYQKDPEASKKLVETIYEESKKDALHRWEKT